MDKTHADLELEEINSALQELETKRRQLSTEEHRLQARKQELMFQFYPEVINEQIEKLLLLRRLRR